MKKALCLAVALLMAMAFAACQSGDSKNSGSAESKTPDVADVLAKLTSEITFPEMAAQTAEQLQYYGYDGIDTANIDQIAYEIASSGQTPEEILILKMKDDTQIADIQTMMKKHRDSIAATAADYTPELVDELNTAVIGAKGVYVYLAITPDNTKAKKILDDMF